MNDQSLKAASKLSLPPEVHEGALLAGRYRIGRMLGSGGMGAVLAAEHVELAEPVAIKVLLRDAAAHTTPEALGRFTREAWAASKIKSEYVARVTDLGRLDDGTPYIVMEYLEGTDLEALLAEQGPLEIEPLVELMLQACEALAEAHALGIFHRDLKPSNLFCIRRSDGVMAIKLLDFGISKIAPAANSFFEARLTGTASTLGTPLYMSPEQMRSGRVADERSDIWSLGVILYEMLLGRVPFMAENLADLAVRVATQLPASISQERTDVPRELERVVLRCLEKESALRFQTVAELAHALTAFGPPRAAAHAERAERILLTQSARSSSPKISTTRSNTLSTAGSHARLRANNAATLSVTKRTPQTIAFAVALAVLVVVLAVAVFRRNSPPIARAPESRKAASERRETHTSASTVPPPAAAVNTAARDELPRATADVLPAALLQAGESGTKEALSAARDTGNELPSAAVKAERPSAAANPHTSTESASPSAARVIRDELAPTVTNSQRPTLAAHPQTSSSTASESQRPAAAALRANKPPQPSAADEQPAVAPAPHPPAGQKHADADKPSSSKDSELESLGGRL